MHTGAGGGAPPAFHTNITTPRLSVSLPAWTMRAGQRSSSARSDARARAGRKPRHQASTGPKARKNRIDPGLLPPPTPRLHSPWSCGLGW